MGPTSKTLRVPAACLRPYTDRMVCRGWRSFAVGMAVVLALPLLAGCNSPDSEPQPTTGNAGPITVEINQSRDQYGKQAIQIQLTNTTDSPLTVTGALLHSTLFEGDITWEPTEGSLELPPRQPKSLPAALPTAACGTSSTDSSREAEARISYSEPGKELAEEYASASDPFGVLTRNASELCTATEATAVATIVLDPELEVAADGRTAVVRLVITPRTGGAAQSLTIESIDGTTLLAESPTAPWPRNVAVGMVKQELPLTIRPARCDPHAVAEDKVGTLLPLRITVGERQGVLKIAASNELRGKIYDFVTSACAGAG